MVALVDTVGAFVPGPRCERPPLGSGRLSGLGFAVKDLYDVAGALTTYGNPDWASTHSPACATAPVVTSLLQAGARLVGKTKTVELAYGLIGENVWQGTPLNPRTPDRFPGGSSCGSAAWSDSTACMKYSTSAAWAPSRIPCSMAPQKGLERVFSSTP